MELIKKVELASIRETITSLKCPFCNNENIEVYDAYMDPLDLNERLEQYDKGDGRPIDYYCPCCDEWFEDFITVVE